MKYSPISLLSILLLFTQSCYEPPVLENTPRGNFEALWNIMDQRYCFFAYKDSVVDWDEVYLRYSDSIEVKMGDRTLFSLLGNMLAEVRDGHVNLYSSFDIARYWAWFESRPQNFDERLLDEYYLDFDYNYVGGIKYKVLPSVAPIAYMRYSSFSTTPGEGSLDQIMNYFAGCMGMIIDVRDNGGGSLSNVERIASRFITERMLSGYIQHKTGSGRYDFSEPYPIYIEPSTSAFKYLDRPVILLTNRSCFSATNDFVSVMRNLPNVVQVGDTTGGGSGLPFSDQLPNGWSVRLSTSPVYNSDMQHTEFGIAPHYAVDMAENSSETHSDAILDRAIQLLNSLILGGR